MATLENVLVPLYLAHRYQVEGVSKVIGGVNYTYAVRGDGQPTNEMVSNEEQSKALSALLSTLDPEFLAIPQEVIDLIPPQPMGYSRDRELFKINTGLTFDPLAAAESSVEHTLTFLLQPQRLARIVEQHARDAGHMSLYELLNTVTKYGMSVAANTPMEMELKRIVQKRTVQHLLQLAGDKSVMQQVSAMALYKIGELESELQPLAKRTGDPETSAHATYLLQQIGRFKEAPEDFKIPEAPALPDGSPIGCGE